MVVGWRWVDRASEISKRARAPAHAQLPKLGRLLDHTHAGTK